MRHFAAVGRNSVLEQVNPLPGAEREPAAHHRNRQRGLGQRRAEMARHVVAAFGHVGMASGAELQTVFNRGGRAAGVAFAA